MNVIVSNKYQALLATLDIDIIKSINGEFEVDDLVSQFANFYFNKMVLDITAIKNYQDINTMQSLSVNMDVSNIILLLDDSEIVNSPSYLSGLVSMGIYNFTRNIDAIKFLINNPNSYKDVAQYHLLNNINTTAATSVATSANTSAFHKLGLRVIGVKNVTEHAGSTTLTYLMKKHLEKKYNCIAVEVDEHDFIYLNDQSLKTTSNIDLPQFIANNSDVDVILVDLNERGSISCCTEVIYLIEPGLIKLNKLIRKDKRTFEKLRDKKIVLNRSVLSDRDVKDFEFESKSKVFFNIPYLDDKLDHHKVLNHFLINLGFVRLEEGNEEKNSKLFNIFKS
jgi:hypothetical protein